MVTDIKQEKFEIVLSCTVISLSKSFYKNWVESLGCIGFDKALVHFFITEGVITFSLSMFDIYFHIIPSILSWTLVICNKPTELIKHLLKVNIWNLLLC